MRLKLNRKLAIIFTLIISLILINPSRSLSALPGKKLLLYTNQANDTNSLTGKSSSEIMPFTTLGKPHLTFSEKVKLMKQMHKYRNQKDGGTHFGLMSFCLAFAPYLIFEIAVVSGATITAGTGIILLIIGFLCYLAAVIFGIKGIRSDKHNGLAIVGLLFGVFGLLGYLLVLLLISQIHAL